MRPIAITQALLLSLCLALAGTGTASALEQKKFESESFKSAQAAGAPLVVHITAPWCPTCKAQHAAIDELAKKPEFASVTVFQVDFDSQIDVVKSFKANQQSTLVAFNGTTETSRLVGQTSPQAIERLFTAAMKK